MYKKLILLTCIGILIYSCEFFKKEELGIPIARVNDTYLYQKNIKNLVSEFTSREDSLIIVTNFINQWATKQLFLANAKINLSDKKQSEFNKLVDQYKTDLFTKAYQEALVNQKIDTSVTLKEAFAVYNLSKETFKLNEELIKFRYINLNENNINFEDVKTRFKRFNNDDKRILDSISIQFRSYSLNDSIWIRCDQAISKISILKAENKKELLKKSNFIELRDSLGLYLMQIQAVLLRNQIAPIEYVMPTIKQIVVNKRKLELIKQLEKDITKDAIKNKEFEIFN